jgi:SSS family solute:Na+ symporter
VKCARRGLAATSVTLFIIYGFIVVIGLLSLPFVSTDETGGSVLSVIIAMKTGKVLGGILFVAVVAAIMSTMDTAVNTGAMSMTHDVYSQLFHRQREKRVLLVSRVSTFAVAALAFLVATRFQSILKTLGLASEIMAVGFFIPGVSMIFLKPRHGRGICSCRFFLRDRNFHAAVACVALFCALWISSELGWIPCRHALR